MRRRICVSSDLSSIITASSSFFGQGWCIKHVISTIRRRNIPPIVTGAKEEMGGMAIKNSRWRRGCLTGFQVLAVWRVVLRCSHNSPMTTSRALVTAKRVRSNVLPASLGSPGVSAEDATGPAFRPSLLLMRPDVFDGLAGTFFDCSSCKLSQAAIKVDSHLVSLVYSC